MAIGDVTPGRDNFGSAHSAHLGRNKSRCRLGANQETHARRPPVESNPPRGAGRARSRHEQPHDLRAAWQCQGREGQGHPSVGFERAEGPKDRGCCQGLAATCEKMLFG